MSVSLYLECDDLNALPFIKKDVKSSGAQAKVLQCGFYEYDIVFSSQQDLMLYKLVGNIEFKPTYRRMKDGTIVPAGKCYRYTGKV